MTANPQDINANPQDLDYLWALNYGEGRNPNPVWYLHRIFRITPKKVFIQWFASGVEHPDGTRQFEKMTLGNRGAWLIQGEGITTQVRYDPLKAIALDRQKLEMDGFAKPRGSFVTIYNAAGKQAHLEEMRRPIEPKIPEYIKILGLPNPYTEDDVDVAFRRIVQENNPESGGDIDTLARIVKARTDALSFLVFLARHQEAQK